MSTLTKHECRICGCTEDHACPGGCGWADKTHTLCTGCAHLVEPLTALAETMVSATCNLAAGRTTDAGGVYRTCMDALIEMEDRVVGPGAEPTEDDPPPPLLVEADRVCEALEERARPPLAYRRARQLRRRITGHAGGSPRQRAANARRKGGGR